MTELTQLRWLLTAAAILLLAATIIADESAPSDTLARGVSEFKAAYEAWDKDRFAIAADRFANACEAAPDSAVAFYWRGAAEFHLALQHRDDGDETAKKKTQQALANAVAAFERALILNPRDGESHAVLGTVYGMMISGNPNRTMELGPRVMRHRRLALQFAPDSPRVHYLSGVSLFQMQGARKNVAAALEQLLKAERLFEKEAEYQQDWLAPHWGYASCLSFIGRIYESQGKVAESKNYFEKALQLNPRDGSAVEGLKRLEAAGKN